MHLCSLEYLKQVPNDLISIRKNKQTSHRLRRKKHGKMMTNGPPSQVNYIERLIN